MSFQLPPAWFAKERKNGSIAVRFESPKDEPFIVKRPDDDLWSNEDIRAHITKDQAGKMFLDGKLVRTAQVRNWRKSSATSRDVVVIDLSGKKFKVLCRKAQIGS